MGYSINPLKFSIDTENDGLKKVVSFKHGNLLVSILDFRGRIYLGQKNSDVPNDGWVSLKGSEQ